MYAKFKVGTIAHLREIEMTIFPGFILKLLGGKPTTRVHRHDGTRWFNCSSGEYVAPKMQAFLERVWLEQQIAKALENLVV